MKSLDLAGPGDVINLTVAARAYPYERSDGRTVLQGRVVHMDEIGVCLATDGSVITPRFGRDSWYVPAPTRGDLFPWSAIKRLVFIETAEAYEDSWRAHLTEEEVFAAAHHDRSPASVREYREWAKTQDPEELEKKLSEASAHVVLG